MLYVFSSWMIAIILNTYYWVPTVCYLLYWAPYICVCFLNTIILWNVGIKILVSKMRLKDAKWFVQGHVENQQWCQDLKIGLDGLKPRQFLLHHHHYNWHLIIMPIGASILFRTVLSSVCLELEMQFVLTEMHF